MKPRLWIVNGEPFDNFGDATKAIITASSKGQAITSIPIVTYGDLMQAIHEGHVSSAAIHRYFFETLDQSTCSTRLCMLAKVLHSEGEHHGDGCLCMVSSDTGTIGNI